MLNFESDHDPHLNMKMFPCLLGGTYIAKSSDIKIPVLLDSWK